MTQSEARAVVRHLTDYEKKHLTPLVQRAQAAQRQVEAAALAAQEARTVLELACALVAGEDAWVNLSTMTVEPLPEKVAEATEAV